MNYIGCSTAAAFRLGVEKAAELVLASGCPVIEVSSLNIAEAGKGLAVLQQLPPMRKSFHLPDKGVSDLNQLSALTDQVPPDCNLVIHPHLLLSAYREHRLDAWRNLGNRLLLENLDCRPVAAEFTHRGCVFRDLLAALPEAQVCLDLAHALSVEPDPDKLMSDVASYVQRIAEIHLSFFSGMNKHCPLDKGHPMWHAAEKFAFQLPSRDRSIVLETPAPTLGEMLGQLTLAQELFP